MLVPAACAVGGFVAGDMYGKRKLRSGEMGGIPGLPPGGGHFNPIRAPLDLLDMAGTRIGGAMSRQSRALDLLG